MSEKVSEEAGASADVETEAAAQVEPAATADGSATDEPRDGTGDEAQAEAEPAESAASDVEDTASNADGGFDEDIAIEVDTSDEDAARVAELEARVAALEQEKDEHYNRLLRTTADLDNFRKRSRRDMEDAKVEVKRSVLSNMLPVIDNLERALEHAEKADDTSAESILEGVKLVLRQFSQAFERVSVSAFDSVGEPFDPNIHEAVGQLPTDEHPPGAVAQELQRGYKIGDRLLRAAMVVVATAPPAEESAGPNGHDKSNGAAGPAAPAADDADDAGDAGDAGDAATAAGDGDSAADEDDGGES